MKNKNSCTEMSFNSRKILRQFLWAWHFRHLRYLSYLECSTMLQLSFICKTYMHIPVMYVHFTSCAYGDLIKNCFVLKLSIFGFYIFMFWYIFISFAIQRTRKNISKYKQVFILLSNVWTFYEVFSIDVFLLLSAHSLINAPPQLVSTCWLESPLIAKLIVGDY